MPIPPFIVHKACNIAEIHLLNLPPGWGVHCSESGYMDEQGFVALSEHFAANCGPVRPQYLLMDGYWSHLIAKALKLLFDQQLFVFILKSQDSERDQVLQSSM